MVADDAPSTRSQSISDVAQRVQTLSIEIAHIHEALNDLTRTFNQFVSENPAKLPDSKLFDNSPPDLPTSIIQEPKVKLPEPFDGSSHTLRNFINQVKLIIRQKPVTYFTEESRVGLLSNLLVGSALDWWSPLFESEDPCLQNFESFLESLKLRFDDPLRSQKAALRLSSIRQGNRSVAAYASQFQLLLADAKWDVTAALFTYQKGLNDQIKDILLTFPTATSLKEIIQQTNEIDNRIATRSSSNHYSIRNSRPRSEQENGAGRG
uniref:Ty3 transposon capsid-like protein domain-containing protein n=1 Tax=Spongospora subterranea TaxID=70186 RepID=A0A0H5QME3_9EUKA|eukprot:CRZ03173.1 hypothetical protein [Spongospora subterranea]